MLTIMHGGYRSVDRKGLHNYEVQVPANAGSRWMGVSHGRLVDGIIQTLKEDHGLVPVPSTETYAVSPNGAALIGGFALGRRTGKIVESCPLVGGDSGDAGSLRSASQSIGFMHSNDLKKAVTIVGGGHVGLCTNGMVHASHRLRRKHTIGLSLMDWLREGIEPMIQSQDLLSDQILHLHDHNVDTKRHDRYLLNLGRDGILPWRLVGEMDNAWATALHSDGEVLPWMTEEEKAEGGSEEWAFNKSVWDWYNIFTHVAKKIPPADQYCVLEEGYNRVLNWSGIDNAELAL